MKKQNLARFRKTTSNISLNKVMLILKLRITKKPNLYLKWLKKKESPFKESATYYFAYINYLNKEYKTALANFEKLKGSPTYEASYPYYITSMYYLDERYDDVIDYAIPAIQNQSNSMNRKC